MGGQYVERKARHQVQYKKSIWNDFLFHFSWFCVILQLMHCFNIWEYVLPRSLEYRLLGFTHRRNTFHRSMLHINRNDARDEASSFYSWLLLLHKHCVDAEWIKANKLFQKWTLCGTCTILCNLGTLYDTCILYMSQLWAWLIGQAWLTGQDESWFMRVVSPDQVLSRRYPQLIINWFYDTWHN